MIYILVKNKLFISKKIFPDGLHFKYILPIVVFDLLSGGFTVYGLQ